MRKRKHDLVLALSKQMLEARKTSGLTQAQVATSIGVSQGALSKMERGILVPSAIQWVEFCKLTQTATDLFLIDPTGATEHQSASAISS
jgi:transcriptional regulator with XRE-family HTH domain